MTGKPQNRGYQKRVKTTPTSEVHASVYKSESKSNLIPNFVEQDCLLGRSSNNTESKPDHHPGRFTQSESKSNLNRVSAERVCLLGPSCNNTVSKPDHHPG